MSTEQSEVFVENPKLLLGPKLVLVFNTALHVGGCCVLESMLEIPTGIKITTLCLETEFCPM